jgi:hypothetical protein
MGKGYNLLHGTSKEEGNLFNVQDVFICNNPKKGFLHKDGFITFLRGLRTEDYDHLDVFFKCLFEGLRNNNSLRIRKDRGDQQYYWLVFPRPNGDEGVKLVIYEGLVNLLLAYREGKVTIDFLLDDLISEALQSSDSTEE